MTPKEKAKELVDKFINATDYNGYGQQCALIAVDEIIKQENAIVPQLLKIIEILMEKRMLNESFKGDVNSYWIEVKQEIEQL